MARRFTAAVLCALCAAILLSSCAIPRRLFGDRDAEEAAMQLQELQLKVMRFADEYVGGVVEPVRRYQLEARTAGERLAAQNWVLSQGTAAYTIASGPNSVTNALDLVVLATLSRMVMEDTWVRRTYGERAMSLRDAHRKLEPDAWSLVGEILTATQIQQLHGVIDDWRAKNPQVRAVTYVHFRDFAKSVGRPSATELQSHGSLFSLLGIDPLNALDPAVRELAQTRQLAERTIYYAQRLPALLDMEVTRLTYELAAMPESRAVLADVNRASMALDAAGSVVRQAPELLAREREAAIHQVVQELTARQHDLLALLPELRKTLEAGTATSESLQRTARGVDGVLARFDKPAATRGANAQPARPFDITEYMHATREVAVTTRQLESLLVQLDSSAPRVGALAERTVREVRGLVDFAFWRLLALGLLLVAAIPAATLVYRLAARRMRLRVETKTTR